MIEIGWASRDITPTRPALIMGQMHRRIGSSALDPLTVTALALGQAESTDHSVLVSCDLCYPSEPLIRRVRETLGSQFSDLPGDRVILHATHTHTSMVIEDGWYEEPDGDVMSPAECETWVAGRIVEAVIEAWETRKPRVIGRAFGHAVVGHNRYAVYADGHADMYGKTNREDFEWFGGYEDHSLDMLFVWEPDGQLKGIVLAIPCPSQVDEHLEQFSADFWHDTRMELRERLGDDLHVLGICSAAGDQSPHFLMYGRQEEEMRQRRGVTERQEIARRVADAVSRALKCTRASSTDAWGLAHRVQRLELPPWQVTRAQRDWAQAAFEQSAARGDTESWWPRRQRQVVECFDGLRRPESYLAELHVLRLGDIAIATNPFELFLDYGMQIKARSAAAQTVLVQLTGRGFYLPSERAVQRGGYGALPAVAFVGPEGGRQFVNETVRIIEELFPDES